MIYIYAAGDNVFLRDQEAKDFVTTFISKHGELAVENIAGESVEPASLADIMLAQPFLTDRRLVKIRALSSNKAAWEELANKADQISDTTDILLIEDRLDARLKINAKLKIIADYREFSVLDETELSDWIIKLFADKGIVAARSDVNYLINRAGLNQQILSEEVKKLTLHGSVNRTIIDELVQENPQTTVFNLLDSMVEGNVQRALKIYQEQRAQKTEPQAILGMITWQLVNLAIITLAGNRSSQEIAAKSSISPYVIRKNQAITQKLTKQKLRKMFEMAAGVDYKLKTRSIQADEAIKYLITELALI